MEVVFLIIIYHIPCFVVVLYFFVNFGSTSRLDDWNSNDCSFGQMLRYLYGSQKQWSAKMFAACRRSFFCLQILSIWKAYRDENGSLSVGLKDCRAYERSEPHSRSECNSSWGVWGRCKPPPPRGFRDAAPKIFGILHFKTLRMVHFGTISYQKSNFYTA